MTQVETGWNNSLSFNGCSASWFVDHNATTLFGKCLFLLPVPWFLDHCVSAAGTTLPDCEPQAPRQFSPIVFWFFTLV